MTGIAHHHPPAWFEESDDNRSGESSVPGKFRELLIEQPDELRLVQAVDEAPHQSPQVGCGRGDRRSMSRDIRQQQAGDPARGAARSIVNVTAMLCIAVGFAVYPHVQPTESYGARGELTASPYLHALHALFWAFAHQQIISGCVVTR